MREDTTTEGNEDTSRTNEGSSDGEGEDVMSTMADPIMRMSQMER